MNKKKIITNVKKDFDRIEKLSNSIMDELTKTEKINIDDETLKEFTKLNQFNYQLNFVYLGSSALYFYTLEYLKTLSIHYLLHYLLLFFFGRPLLRKGSLQRGDLQRGQALGSFSMRGVQV